VVSVPALTLVTPPLPPLAAIVIPPELFVMVTLDPAVRFAGEYPPPEVPMSSCPVVGAVVVPVPPLAIDTGVDREYCKEPAPAETDKPVPAVGVVAAGWFEPFPT